MIKKTVTYENFEGSPVSEELFFNISKAQLIEMSMDGTAQRFEKLNSKDGAEIVATIKDIISLAYGEKTPDGKFLKSKLRSEEFATTEAYSELLYELCTDPMEAASFIENLFPSNLAQEVEKLQARAAALEVEEAPRVSDSKKAATPRTLTRVEMTELPADELQAGLMEGRYKLA